jgi:hypothetical protein
MEKLRFYTKIAKNAKKEKAPETCSEARRAEAFFAPFAILV